MLYKLTRPVIFPKRYAVFSKTFKRHTVTVVGFDVIRQQILNCAHLNTRFSHPGLYFL